MPLARSTILALTTAALLAAARADRHDDLHCSTIIIGDSDEASVVKKVVLPSIHLGRVDIPDTVSRRGTELVGEEVTVCSSMSAPFLRAPREQFSFVLLSGDYHGLEPFLNMEVIQYGKLLVSPSDLLMMGKRK